MHVSLCSGEHALLAAISQQQKQYSQLQHDHQRCCDELQAMRLEFQKVSSELQDMTNRNILLEQR